MFACCSHGVADMPLNQLDPACSIASLSSALAPLTGQFATTNFARLGVATSNSVMCSVRWHFVAWHCRVVCCSLLSPVSPEVDRWKRPWIPHVLHRGADLNAKLCEIYVETFHFRMGLHRSG